MARLQNAAMVTMQRPLRARSQGQSRTPPIVPTMEPWPMGANVLFVELGGRAFWHMLLENDSDQGKEELSFKRKAQWRSSNGIKKERTIYV